MPRSATTAADPPTDPATVLLAGFSGTVAEELVQAPPAGCRVVPVADEAAAARALATPELRAMCLGPSLTPVAVRTIADRVIALDPSGLVQLIILRAGTDLERFRDLVDADRVFYLAAQPPTTAEIRTLLESAADRRPAGDAGSAVPTLAVEWLLRLVETLDEEEDEGQISRLSAQTVRALVDADAGECLLFDREEDTLVGWTPGTAESRRETAAAGLVGWAARTAQTVRVARVGTDPRYEAEADSDGGSPEERFLAVPAVSTGGATGAPSRVRAVLVARRRAGAAPFDDVEEATLALLGAQLAPLLERLGLRRRIRGGDGARRLSPAVGEPLFREEALAGQAEETGRRGRPLALAPAWTRRTYQLLLGLFVASLALLSWGSVHEYAEGVAVVRIEDRIEVSASTAGIVEDTRVAVGQAVEEGELLVRLDGASEAAELERIRGELELALLNRLRDPTSPPGQGRVGPLREELRLAEARLEERSIRAPVAGAVVDRRVEAGQPVAPGQTLVTLASAAPTPGGQPSVIVFFPGRYRPLLGEGMPLRLELEGHRGVRHLARIGEVGDGVVGPAEARRILGAGVADAIPLTGSVVVVRAPLPSVTFESDGRTYRYHDGLLGRAEARVRSDGLLTTLLPGLKGLFGGSDA